MSSLIQISCFYFLLLICITFCSLCGEENNVLSICCVFHQNSQSGSWLLGKISESFMTTVISALWRSQEALPDAEKCRVSKRGSAASFCLAFPFPFTYNLIILLIQTMGWALDVCPKQGEKQRRVGDGDPTSGRGHMPAQ